MFRRSPSPLALMVFGTLALCIIGCGGGGGGAESGGDSASQARLASLISSVGVLDPVFEAGTTEYDVWTGSSTTSILLVPTPSDAGATITVNGGPPGVPLAIDGFALDVDIVVTSPDGSAVITYSVTVIRVPAGDYVDPDPLTGDRFGHSVAVLGNGLVVVTDPYDGAGALQAGAVHLYNPFSAVPIASVRGESIAELLGQGGITPLTNDNFVVWSAGGVNAVGTVRLIDGVAGTQIGLTLASALPDDFESGRVTALPNGNYVVVTYQEDVGGIVDAGAVRLFSGTTGTQIGGALVGDVAVDFVGNNGVTPLGNSNYLVASGFDDVGGVPNAGSVRLFSGTTGAEIGSGLVGALARDFDVVEIASLPNGNYVVVSVEADEGGVVEAGTFRLFNGVTGVQIGTTVSGGVERDYLGYSHVAVLENSNIVIASELDDEGGVVDAGSVRLFSGVTGAQIGPTLAGDVDGDELGDRIALLTNGNFVVASPRDDEGGVVDAGSVRLVSGTTGMQIGPALVGDSAGDRLGSSALVALSNGNYVVNSSDDDVGGIVDAGSVRLVDGVTGMQIGTALAGDSADDQLGYRETVALANGNFVVASIRDGVNGVARAGSVRLVSGTTGTQIGPTLAGDAVQDEFGSGGITALGNSNYLVSSPGDNVGGVVDAGSLRLMSGVTGTLLQPALVGAVRDDQERTSVAAPVHGGYVIVGFALWDNGSIDSGRVRQLSE